MNKKTKKILNIIALIVGILGVLIAVLGIIISLTR